MATLIFRLRNVPEDEADDIRALLDEHDFRWYETSAGNWGIALPGLWIEDEGEATKARALIDTYQENRTHQQRQKYEEDKQSGELPSLIKRFKQQPVKVTGIMLFCLFITYVSINPFIKLAEWMTNNN